MNTLAVGRVIRALPVVDRALEPSSLWGCRLRACPWPPSTREEGSRALAWRLGRWYGAAGARAALRPREGPGQTSCPVSQVCAEGGVG